MNILFETVFGSHLYGTDTPSSDKDFKGIYLPPLDSLILGRAESVVSLKRSKLPGEKNTAEDVDREFMSLQKFIKLACEGQMVAIDMLHASQDMWTRTSPVWEELYMRREEFYSRNMSAFVGYARRQAAKYGVKGSRLACAREWLKLLEEEPDLSMQTIVWAAVDQFPEGHSIWEHARPYPDPHNPTICLEALGKQFTGAAKAKHYLPMMKQYVEEYGERARQAENNEGIDWKAMSHAVRAALEVLTILDTAPARPDYRPKLVLPLDKSVAKELVDIKLGKLSFRAVADRLEWLMQDIEKAAAVSTLPDRIDPRSFDDLILRAYKESSI